MTSLHWACKRGLYKISALLIDFGSDVDALDLVGRTPLFFCLKFKHTDIAKVNIFCLAL